VQHAHEIGVGMFATLAIAIARRFPALRLTTSSIDADEVESAVRTARANGIELACTRSDVLEQVHGEFDLIWWNLPYYAPGVVEAVDRLCHQVEERNLLRAGGEIQLGFNTVPLAREDVEAVVERRPGLRVRHARTYWYNPHCILTITSR
jgi:16S rRNA G1207 methylase RsmC